jgi:hypothetical protein
MAQQAAFEWRLVSQALSYDLSRSLSRYLQ